MRRALGGYGRDESSSFQARRTFLGIAQGNATFAFFVALGRGERMRSLTTHN